MMAPPSKLAVTAGFVLQGISKGSEFAVVDSVVEVGFDYRCLVCITRDF